MRGSVERFSRYLKERMMILHSKMSVKNHIEETRNLNLLLELMHYTIKLYR